MEIMLADKLENGGCERKTSESAVKKVPSFGRCEVAPSPCTNSSKSRDVVI